MKWIEIGFKFLPYVVGAVTAVERLFEKRDDETKEEKSKRKQNAAIDAIGAMLAAVEGGLSKDLLDNNAVKQALRDLIDAYVSLQNVIASASAKPV